MHIASLVELITEAETGPSLRARPKTPKPAPTVDSLGRIVEDLKSIFETEAEKEKTPEKEDPDAYRKRTGSCPDGYHFNGEKCEPSEGAKADQPAAAADKPAAAAPAAEPSAAPAEPAAADKAAPAAAADAPAAAPTDAPKTSKKKKKKDAEQPTNTEVPEGPPEGSKISPEDYAKMSPEEQRLAHSEESRDSSLKAAGDHAEEHEDALADEAMDDVDEDEEDAVDDVLKDKKKRNSPEGKSMLGSFLTGLAGVIALGALSAVFPAGIVMAAAGAYVAKKAADKLLSSVTEAAEQQPQTARELAKALTQHVTASLRDGISNDELAASIQMLPPDQKPEKEPEAPAPTPQQEARLRRLIGRAKSL